MARHYSLLSLLAVLCVAPRAQAQESGGQFGLVKFNPRNWIGLALRPRLLRLDYPGARTHFDASAGLEFSGPPALLVSAVGFLALLAAFASCNCAGD
ncbi:MAG TPA: hypothetical protein VKQ05_00755 [Gemmatimonadales bacterium]|nr:hypothetical protein [Gemmatimonadales bacterium]